MVGHHWALAGLLGATIIAQQWTPFCLPILANLIPGNNNPFGFVVNSSGVAQAMTFWDAVCPLISQMALMLEHQPLRVVADAYLMGHQSFETTLQYAHLSEDHVKRQVLKLPFANG